MSTFLNRLLGRTPPNAAAAAPRRANDVAKKDSPSISRARSLSQAFNQLPASLPTLPEMQLDLLEYICHTSLLATKPRTEEIQTLLASIPPPLPTYGRIYNRLSLAALQADVGIEIGSPPSPEDVALDTSTRESTSSLCDLSADDWNRILQELESLKVSFSRMDANYDASSKAEDVTVNEEVSNHDVMTVAFPQVVETIKVLYALISLKQDIHQLAVERARDTKRHARSALDEFEESLQEITTALPEVLKFKLADKPSNVVSWLLTQIQEVLFHDDCVYSYANVQKQIQSLLIEWSERILDTPTLFQLGYGGVLAPLDGKEDDVSAIGDDEREDLMTQPLMTQMDVVTEGAVAPASIRATVAAPPLEQRLSSDEMEILRRLAPENEQVSATKKLNKKRSPVADILGSDSDDDLPRRPFSSNKKKRAAIEQLSATTKAKKMRSPVADILGSDSESELPSKPFSSNKKKGVAQKQAPPPSPKDDLFETDSEEENMRAHQNKRRKGQKRVPFTDDEVEAIKEGIQRFGVGYWEEIKKHANGRLDNRTGVQIKDKYRTMNRTNQI